MDDLYINQFRKSRKLWQGNCRMEYDWHISILSNRHITTVGEHLVRSSPHSWKRTILIRLKQQGELWAIAGYGSEDAGLPHSQCRTVHGSLPVLSKHLSWHAVYDKLIYPDEGTTVSSDYESTRKPLLTSMITVSDNDSANELVRKLGGGDYPGWSCYCQCVSVRSRSYTSTHLGREFLASDPTDDNYTSASDWLPTAL